MRRKSSTKATTPKKPEPPDLTDVPEISRPGFAWPEGHTPGDRSTAHVPGHKAGGVTPEPSEGIVEMVPPPDAGPAAGVPGIPGTEATTGGGQSIIGGPSTSGGPPEGG